MVYYGRDLAGRMPGNGKRARVRRPRYRVKGKPARRRPQRKSKGNGGLFSTGGITVRSTCPVQQVGHIGGKTAMRKQVVNQQMIINGATWVEQAVTQSVPNYHDFGGTAVQLGDLATVVDTTDIDMTVDVNPALLLWKGSGSIASRGVSSSLDLFADFAYVMLPKLPIRLCNPGNLFQIIQIKFNRMGAGLVNGTQRWYLPGQGTFGDFSQASIRWNTNVTVRYRITRLSLMKPMFYVLPAAALGLTLLPLVVWERMWKLKVPAQDSYNRFITGGTASPQSPLVGAYTFSVIPAPPFSFTWEHNAVGVYVVDWAQQFNANTTSDVAGPQVGLVSEVRRDPLVVATTVFLSFRFRQRGKRVYIRITLEGVRVPYNTFRSNMLRVALPGYDSTGTPITAMAPPARQLEALSHDGIPLRDIPSLGVSAPVTDDDDDLEDDDDC